ncbi:MAG: hemolysin family protein [Firmicutes bacterium]|nr:hemolysin family protein [Bacillota bacterium]
MIVSLLIIIILTTINGFFAASEMALVSITPNQQYKLQQQGHRNAAILKQVTSDSTKYLSTIQVAITFAGFLSSAFAGTQFSGQITMWFSSVGINIPQQLVVVLITLILSYFILIFGELVPKRIALAKSTSFALFCAPIIRVVMLIFRPFVFVLSLSTTAVMKVLGMANKNGPATITESDVKEMIAYGHIKGLYPSEERLMLERIFQLDDLTASMIMTPRHDVTYLDLKNLSPKAIKQVLESRYSRIPVVDGGWDHLKGVILVKDIMVELEDQNLTEIELHPHIRNPLIINASITINVLFKQMKELSAHMAFVMRPNGSVKGIVTMEDIMEEIVGNIYDEHDVQANRETLDDLQTYIIEGTMIIDELNRRLGRKLFPKEDKDITIGSYLLTELGEKITEKPIPRVSFEHGYIDVLSMVDDNITQVRLIVQPKSIYSKPAEKKTKI